MEMIKKIDLIDGKTYKGFCRGNFIATWDAKKDKFYHLAWQFQPYVDWICHFEDTKETRVDGFVPLEIIERFDEKDIEAIKKEIGY